MIVDDWKKAVGQMNQMIEDIFFMDSLNKLPLPYVEIPYWNHSKQAVYFTNLIKEKMKEVVGLMGVCSLIFEDWKFEKNKKII